jgi:hypothetical protein
MAQRDTVLRWIEQLGRLIARLLRGESGGLPAAREQIATATGTLLGPLALLAPRLDPESAAELLGDPWRIFGWAQLLDLEAMVAEAEGNHDAAKALRSRALTLAAEAVRRADPPHPEWAGWIAERTVPDIDAGRDGTAR